MRGEVLLARRRGHRTKLLVLLCLVVDGQVTSEFTKWCKLVLVNAEHLRLLLWRLQQYELAHSSFLALNRHCLRRDLALHQRNLTVDAHSIHNCNACLRSLAHSL